MGSYLWALDSYTKFAFGPVAPYGIDWVKEFENGTYQHTAEPRHATFAITDTAVQHMQVYALHDHGYMLCIKTSHCSVFIVLIIS